MTPQTRAPKQGTNWLPAFGWWPPADEFAAAVHLSTHAATIAEEGRYEVAIRGYAGAAEPAWERRFELGPGDYRAVRLDELDVPDPPSPGGGILEVHTVRLDAEPPGERPRWLWQWMDVQGKRGGGYLIPLVPFRGAKTRRRRDDLQVVPGVVVNREVETEILVMNLIPTEMAVRLVLASPDGLTSEAEIAVPGWSAWRADLSQTVPRARRLLSDSDGVGSLAVYSSHKTMAFFGLRKGANPVTSMDHGAVIFA